MWSATSIVHMNAHGIDDSYDYKQHTAIHSKQLRWLMQCYNHLCDCAVLVLSHYYIVSTKDEELTWTFCVKQSKTAAESYKKLCETSSNEALGRTRTYQWYEHFQNGRTLTEDGEESDWPWTSIKLFDFTSQRHYPCQSSTDCIGSSGRDWNTHWLMSHYFKKRFKNVSGL
jgi:hypothetical protein